MVVISGLFAAYYRLALRNRKLHAYNRFYLLAALLLSILLPLLPFHWAPFPAVSRPMLGGTVERIENMSRSAEHGIPRTTIFCITGGVVSLVMLLLSVGRVMQVYRLKSGQPVCRMEGYDWIDTDDPGAPFSFLTNLFWRRDADPNDPVNKKILCHELAHIAGRHSWDSLFAQIVCCIGWMNPFFWLMRRELSVVHEFIADEATGMEGDTEGFARMLLQSLNERRFFMPAQGFFQSPIKRRLAMIGTERKDRWMLLRKTLALPLVVIVVGVVSCTKSQPATSQLLDKIDLEKLMHAKTDQDQKQRLFLKLLRQTDPEKVKKLLVTLTTDSTVKQLKLKKEFEVKFLEFERNGGTVTLKKQE